MTKTSLVIEHVVITFIEAAAAYLIINQTALHGKPKLAAIGAVGAGLSAVYNVLRQSTPTVPQNSTQTPATVVKPMNGVPQLTAAPDPNNPAENTLTDDTILDDLAKEDEQAPPTPRTV